MHELRVYYLNTWTRFPFSKPNHVKPFSDSDSWSSILKYGRLAPGSLAGLHRGAVSIPEGQHLTIPGSRRVEYKYKPKPNSWTHNVVEVSGHNLESSVGDLWHFGAEPDPYLWLMDPDPDPTSDPTPFFIDFKDANKIFFSYFCLITCPQAHHLQAKLFLLKFVFKFYEKWKGSGSGAGSAPLTHRSGSGRPNNMRILRIRISSTAWEFPDLRFLYRFIKT